MKFKNKNLTYIRLRQMFNGGWSAIILGLIAVGVVVCVILGILALIWLLWGTVMTAIWPTGPAQFIDPGYWLFVGMWFLAAFIGNLFKR